MNTMTHGLVLAAGFCIAPAMAVGGERKDAEITCEPTGERLVYDCTVTVTKRRSGDPVTDAEFTVGADMPSMPGATTSSRFRRSLVTCRAFTVHASISKCLENGQ